MRTDTICATLCELFRQNIMHICNSRQLCPHYLMSTNKLERDSKLV